MKKRHLLICIYFFVLSALLYGCGNYKPPYQRGYDEGYAAGVEAAGGSVPEASEESGESDTDTAEERTIPSLLTVGSDEDGETEEDESSDAAQTDDAQTDDAESNDPETDVTGEEEQGSDTDVLGEGAEPSGDTGTPAGIPEGRIITADAVNEALYSNPEVIDGLREIYADTAIFGEFVGDSETNLLHKVGGEHFSTLGYDTIVVFDGSKSLQDILDEGFYTKCSCIGE
ncbi:MAG: hypothetical protein IJV16_05325 [Lachnospiraceae bacterium]|nr:hypothetical protein [Lachnospiraceae bacterium]